MHKKKAQRKSTRRLPPVAAAVGTPTQGVGGSSTDVNEVPGLDEPPRPVPGLEHDSDAFDTDDEDEPIGRESDVDDADPDEDDDGDSLISAADNELKGIEYEDEGQNWRGHTVAWSFEDGKAMAYHYDVDEVDADEVDLSDCFWMPCDEMRTLIERGGDPAPRKSKKAKRKDQDTGSGTVAGAGDKRKTRRKAKVVTGAQSTAKRTGKWKMGGINSPVPANAKTRIDFTGQHARYRPSAECKLRSTDHPFKWFQQVYSEGRMKDHVRYSNAYIKYCRKCGIKSYKQVKERRLDGHEKGCISSMCLFAEWSSSSPQPTALA